MNLYVYIKCRVLAHIQPKSLKDNAWITHEWKCLLLFRPCWFRRKLEKQWCAWKHLEHVYARCRLDNPLSPMQNNNNRKNLIIISVLAAPVFSIYKYATRESYNSQRIKSLHLACIFTVFNLDAKKNCSYIIFIIYAHTHHTIKWKIRNVWTGGNDNEYTRCYTFRYTIIEFWMEMSMCTYLCRTYRTSLAFAHIHTHIHHTSIDRIGGGNVTFYHINNIGHKADGWKCVKNIHMAVKSRIYAPNQLSE